MIRYERRKISDLVVDDHNPRTMSTKAKKALAASIKRFGLVQPIVVNETTGRVVGGHQRIVALREQGAIEVDVAIGAWTADEERVLNVALNNQAAQGQFTDVRSYLDGALRALSLDDFKTLQLDALVFDGAKEKTYDDKMGEVEDVDVSDINGARFQISIIGDLAIQDAVLNAIRDATRAMKVEIIVGLAETNARG